ncbi:MAG: proline--tRNA ligase [Candidatus Pacebacteria bacterium]|nr:proline--tRNA ligase [Candidatus Paceibacterota bacterium]
MAKRFLTPKTENISEWYNQVIQRSGLADNAPVRGCMVIRPRGYAIWEHIQNYMNQLFAELGIDNAYFPLFIPMSLLEKEADHVEGFSPELAVVTHGGGKELQEKLAVRPTSETIMYDMFGKWVQSWRDLPLKLNQWANVVRWEKRTYFFLRTTEFLWQEGHTAHATHDEAWQMVLAGLETFRQTAEELLAVPVACGYKSESEKFAGADTTITIEALMPDGKAVQSGTSHDLGQNFSQESAFDISFQNQDGQTEYAWQTSFGLSTRIIGALILTHGDDEGLVLPPKVAKTQVRIIPATFSDLVIAKAKELEKELKQAGIRVELNQDDSSSLGYKLNEAELQGVPVSLILGERELETNQATLLIRHSQQKEKISLDQVVEKMPGILIDIHDQMLTKARQKIDDLTYEVEEYGQLKEIMNTTKGFIKAYWCESEKCEEEIQQETTATTRCLPFTDNQGNVEEGSGVCIKCGQPAKHRWLFAQAY